MAIFFKQEQLSEGLTYPYILKQEAWVELIDVATAYIKLNPSGECLPSDSRTYFKENGFRYTDGQKRKLLKTVSGGLTDYMSDWHRENLNKNEFRADY